MPLLDGWTHLSRHPMQIPFLFINAHPNIDGREKGLVVSAVRSHTTKLVMQKKRKNLVSRFKKSTPPTRTASPVEVSYGATPTTASMLDLAADDPSQPVQQQLRDQDIEQAIENSVSEGCMMPYVVSESKDLNDVKSPMGWLNSHRFDPFDTLPSKVTQNFITVWNLYSECVIGF